MRNSIFEIDKNCDFNIKDTKYGTRGLYDRLSFKYAEELRTTRMKRLQQEQFLGAYDN